MMKRESLRQDDDMTYSRKLGAKPSVKRANSGNGGKRFSRFALPVSSRASAEPVGLDSSSDTSTTD